MSEQAANLCPHCGRRGRRVELQTVQAMLSVSLNRIEASDYRFCPTPGCQVVYYAGQAVFTELDVRERVYHKHPDDESVFICYCYQHTLGELRRAGQETDKNSVLVDIERGVAAGTCACELRNPQGACCLGNVRTAFQSSRSTTS